MEDLVRPEESAGVARSCSAPLDPRIRRTRELLQEALASLLETSEFDQISVQDITDAATVNRATFYAHYPDKFALLECMVAGRFEKMLEARGVVFDGTCFMALNGIALGVCDYLAQTLGHAPQGVADRHMEPHLEAAVVAVVRQMILVGLTQHPPDLPVSIQMLAATLSWAIYGAAKEWAQTPGRTPSEEIAPMIVSLVLPMLTSDEAMEPRAELSPA
jgi:AcrR family transcriptional regulator